MKPKIFRKCSNKKPVHKVFQSLSLPENSVLVQLSLKNLIDLTARLLPL